MNRQSVTRSRPTTDRPWDGHRGTNPLAVYIQLENLARKEATRDVDHPLEVLRRSSPEQIAAASVGCTGPGATAAQIQAAWARLRAEAG
jgi:hypothetical protein